MSVLDKLSLGWWLAIFIDDLTFCGWHGQHGLV
jgi:hypothetical protein